MNGQFKKGFDWKGWLGIVIVIGILWSLLLLNSYKEYYVIKPIELVKLVVAMLGTVIIWLIAIAKSQRGWQDDIIEAMKWQAEHDVAVIEKLEGLQINKLQEIHNIVGDAGAPAAQQEMRNLGE